MRRLDVALVGLTIGYGVSQAVIARRLGPVGRAALRLQLTRHAATFTSILDGWDEEELARYRSHLPPDMIHPLIYASALTVGVIRLDQLRPIPTGTHRLLMLAPAVSALGDYIENVVHWHLLDHRDAISPRLIKTVGAISTAKWMIALGTLGYLLQGYPRAWRRTGR